MARGVGATLSDVLEHARLMTERDDRREAVQERRDRSGPVETLPASTQASPATAKPLPRWRQKVRQFLAKTAGPAGFQWPAPQVAVPDDAPTKGGKEGPIVSDHPSETRTVPTQQELREGFEAEAFLRREPINAESSEVSASRPASTSPRAVRASGSGI
jgi:hypothetical protein